VGERRNGKVPGRDDRALVPSRMIELPASGFIVTVDDVAAVANGEEPESE
jgi:hypothetical protein